MAGGVGTWYKMTSGELSKRFGLDTSSVSSFMAPMGYGSMADIGDLFASESDFDHVEDYSLVAAAMDRAFGNFCDASFVLEGDTETSRVQGWRDGKQVRDINRTVTYKPGTTAPKTVPDEGANVASLIDVLKAAE